MSNYFRKLLLYFVIVTVFVKVVVGTIDVTGITGAVLIYKSCAK